VLVTSIEGERETLRSALRPLARFRRGGYPNVLVATVDDRAAFLSSLAGAMETSEALRRALGKVVPIDRTLRFAEPASFVDRVSDALRADVDRLAGATFFVRVSRRGFRHALGSTEAEREIGARLVDALTARGETPHVRFADPDVVVAIETLRDEVGIALLPRALRQAYPFVRVR